MIIEEKLEYCKVRQVKSPCRAHQTDAGIDFFVPENITESEFREKCQITKDQLDLIVEDGIVKTIFVKPGQSVLIPSGIHVKLIKGYALIYMNKSGVASKKNLHVGACVVDEPYQGECHLNLTNVGTTLQKIESGDKLVQGLVIPINYCQVKEVESLEKLYSGNSSDRGSGALGSSGTK